MKLFNRLNSTHSLLHYLALALVLTLQFACGPVDPYENYYGEAQGTTFSIKYDKIEEGDYEEEIDSILISMDAYFSTYIEHSYISQFNTSLKGIQKDPIFSDLWEKCWELSIETDGLFDPTLAPVFEAYKMMDKTTLDSQMVLEALKHTGIQLVGFTGDSLTKKSPYVKIGLDAIAQGYSVDVIAEFLETKSIKNYMVEIGGEVRTSGVNSSGKIWTLGIDKPKDGQRELIAKLPLKNASMATSGNYRKFIEIDGKKLGHIINPKTGFPGYTDVLSVSVISKECYRADALATALMTMSADEIKEFDRNTESIDLILIELQGNDTLLYVSDDLKAQMVK